MHRTAADGFWERWGLRLPAPLEDEFRASYAQSNRLYLRLAVVILGCLYAGQLLASTVFGLEATPDRILPTCLRLAVLLLIGGLTFHPRVTIWSQQWTVLLVLLGGIDWATTYPGQIAAVRAAPLPRADVAALAASALVGLGVVATYVLFHLRFLAATAAGMLTTIIMAGSLLVRIQPPVEVALPMLQIMVIANALGMATAYAAEASRRREFLQERRAQELHKQVEELHLEIDRVTAARQVAEITENEAFRALQERAQQMRQARRSPPG